MPNINKNMDILNGYKVKRGRDSLCNPSISTRQTTTGSSGAFSNFFNNNNDGAVSGFQQLSKSKKVGGNI